MKKNKKFDPYLEKLLRLYPNIASGRKNYLNHDKRIKKTLKIIKKFFNRTTSNYIL